MIRQQPRPPLFPSTPLFRSSEARIVELKGTATTIDVPVREEMVPNVFVGVLLVRERVQQGGIETGDDPDRKSTRLNSSHSQISYAVFCLKRHRKGIVCLLDR